VRRKGLAAPSLTDRALISSGPGRTIAGADKPAKSAGNRSDDAMMFSVWAYLLMAMSLALMAAGIGARSRAADVTVVVLGRLRSLPRRDPGRRIRRRGTRLS
jgi:hypothetical protein